MLLASAGGGYDPDEPEGSTYRRQTVTFKQVLIVSAVLVVLTVVLWPVFARAMEDRDSAVCKQNMSEIGKAMLLYSANNSDILPPTHFMDADGEPVLVDGRPVTWVTQIQPLMSKRFTFVCPSSTSAERVSSVSLEEGVAWITSSYGMYRGLSAVPKTQIPNPGEVVSIAETSDHRAAAPFDPVPYKNAPDGFAIGWDTGNTGFIRETKEVTRLAFRTTKEGTIAGRHKDIVFAVSAEGALKKLRPEMLKVFHSPPRLKGMWWADPNWFR